MHVTGRIDFIQPLQGSVAQQLVLDFGLSDNRFQCLHYCWQSQPLPEHGEQVILLIGRKRKERRSDFRIWQHRKRRNVLRGTGWTQQEGANGFHPCMTRLYRYQQGCVLEKTILKVCQFLLLRLHALLPDLLLFLIVFWIRWERLAIELELEFG